MMYRRNFLSMASLAASAAAVGTFAGTDLAFGKTANGKTFIKIFCRGGADGLHLFPAIHDDNYYRSRPEIGVPSSGAEAALSLDYAGTKRGLNPNLEPLLDIWADGRMMISPATGFPGNARSHFQAQTDIGRGEAGANIDGYLNRYLQLTDRDETFAGAVLGKNVLSGEFKGAKPVPVIPTAEGFGLRNPDFCSDDGCAENQLLQELQRLSNENHKSKTYFGDIVRANAALTESYAVVEQAVANYDWKLTGQNDPESYSTTSLGRGLKLAAQLLNDRVPLEVATIDWDMSWDMHTGTIANGSNPFTNQSFARNYGMHQGALDIATFYQDLKIRGLLDNVVVLVCTEFGRTILQNGNKGTDHGHGGAWFMFGGDTKRQMLQDMGDIPDPRNEISNAERFVPYAVNYKNILAEVMVRHLGLPSDMVKDVLPGWQWQDLGLLTA